MPNLSKSGLFTIRGKTSMLKNAKIIVSNTQGKILKFCPQISERIDLSS